MRRRMMACVGSGFSALDYLGAKGAKAGTDTPLIAMWDGIENAGWGTHSQSISFPVELCGSGIVFDKKKGDLVINKDNFYSNGDCIFESSNAQSIINAVLGSNFTSEVCIKLDPDKWSAVWPPFFTVGTNSNRIFWWWFFKNTGQRAYAQVNNSSVNVAYPANSILSLSFAFGTTGGVLRLNNDISANMAYTEPYETSRDKVCLFGKDSSYISSYVYNMRFYSRALTSSEIAHNYAVDKARFGLT